MARWRAARRLHDEIGGCQPRSFRQLFWLSGVKALPKVDLSFLRDARWFGTERAVGYAKVLLVAYIPGLLICYFGMIGRIGSDYLAYWSAAQIALHGNPAGAYDNATQSAFQLALGRPYFFPFLYPPPFLALVLPFGLLPYAVSLPVWVASTFAVYLAIARNIMKQAFWPIAAFSAVYVNASYAQNGFVTASLFIGGVLALKRWPFVAGLLFGALVIKPHLALLIPVALVAARQWRAFAGAAVSSVGLLAAALVAFGEQTSLSYLHAALGSASMLTGSQPHIKLIVSLLPKTPSAFALARLLGVSSAIALGVQLVAVGILGLVVWRVWSGPVDMLAKGATLASAAVLATPYLLDYDLVLLILPITWLAREGMRRGFWPWEKAMLVIAFWMPFIGQATTAVVGMNLALFSSLMLLWMVLRRWRETLRDAGSRLAPVVGVSAAPA